MAGQSRHTTRVPPTSLAQPFRRAVEEIDPDLPVDVRRLDEQVALQYWQLLVFGAMSGIFAGVALLLATVDPGDRHPVALGSLATSILRMGADDDPDRRLAYQSFSLK
jgi:hypothetical protein